MVEQMSFALEGSSGETERFIPISRLGRRYHPLSMAPQELVEGGCFDYSAAPAVFLGRTGWGPLRIGWDTNILIDWRDFGLSLLEDDKELPTGLDPVHARDLLALGSIMNFLWMVRDVRIRPLLSQLDDLGRLHKTVLGSARRADRQRQLDELAAAFRCIGLDEADEEQVHPTVEWQAPFVRSSPDRSLIEEALTSGCHAFLTRDKAVLRHDERLCALGLRLLPPTGLRDELWRAGELFRPFGPDGMACDSHKWGHVQRATGPAAS